MNGRRKRSSRRSACGDEVAEADKKGRVDLREQPFVTIDGADARDFDDAVYARKTQRGFKLWVAIADVSHYVDKDSPLDAEAQRRATSVYFPDHVVPMLPEALSNGLCSLNPGGGSAGRRLRDASRPCRPAQVVEVLFGGDPVARAAALRTGRRLAGESGESAGASIRASRSR